MVIDKRKENNGRIIRRKSTKINKIKEIDKDRVNFGNGYYDVNVIKNNEGLIIDVYDSDNELIDSFTYWNDDVKGRFKKDGDAARKRVD